MRIKYQPTVPNSLNSSLTDKPILKPIKISGTTNEFGEILVTCKNKFSGEIFCLTNVRSTLALNYIVVVEMYNKNEILFRVRNASDNSAVKNTSVDFTVCVIGLSS